MKIRLQKYSYRFAEEVLNSQLSLKLELEQILTDSAIEFSNLSRPKYNSLLEVVCFVQEEFDRDGGALVRLIKKEGIRLV